MNVGGTGASWVSIANDSAAGAGQRPWGEIRVGAPRGEDPDDGSRPAPVGAPYRQAFDDAERLHSTSHGGSTYLQRQDVGGSLLDAAEFVAAHTGEDPGERYAVLRMLTGAPRESELVTV